MYTILANVVFAIHIVVIIFMIGEILYKARIKN